MSAADRRSHRLVVSVGDTVRYGSAGTSGVVEGIRIIETARSVPFFSGDGNEVALSIRNNLGVVSIWAKDDLVERVDAEVKRPRKTSSRATYRS